MAKLKLTIAFDKYDYLQPLRDGQIEVEGIAVANRQKS